mgnify:CR=1 FL=1
MPNISRIWSYSEGSFYIPRIWSNSELKKFSGHFKGNVINVSAWKDKDKEGYYYRDYFSKASEYWTTNLISEDVENEILLDLSIPLKEELHEKFDVVFNHTVLEHVFELETAFNNLCDLSNDIVIIVVPFLQEEHGIYGFGDYWRFTPQAIDKLFKLNDMETIYINYNNHKESSIYVFAIGSKKKHKWNEIINHPSNKCNEIYEVDIGRRIIKGTLLGYIKSIFRKYL